MITAAIIYARSPIPPEQAENSPCKAYKGGIDIEKFTNAAANAAEHPVGGGTI